LFAHSVCLHSPLKQRRCHSLVVGGSSRTEYTFQESFKTLSGT